MVSRTVINRLMASKEAEAGTEAYIDEEITQREAGEYAGRFWAERDAEWGELSRLALCRHYKTGVEWELAFLGHEQPDQAAIELYDTFGDCRRLQLGNADIRAQAREFWHEVAGGGDPYGGDPIPVATRIELPSAEFVLGFANGALDVHREVAPFL